MKKHNEKILKDDNGFLNTITNKVAVCDKMDTEKKGIVISKENLT